MLLYEYLPFDFRWIYPILDWHQKLAPVYYTLCFALNITCFFLMYAVFRVREKIAAKRNARTHAYNILAPAPAYTSISHAPASAKSQEPSSVPNYGSMVQYPSLAALTSSLALAGDTSLKSFSSIPILPPTAPAVLVGTGAM